MRRYTTKQRNADTRRRVQAQLQARGLGRQLACAVSLRIPWKILRLMDMQFSMSNISLDTTAPEPVVSSASSPPPLT